MTIVKGLDYGKVLVFGQLVVLDQLMARAVRTQVVDETIPGVYHCTNRCVRGAYLFGRSPFSGREHDYRLQVQQRLEFLAGHFAVDVLCFAIMSDHLHVVIRNRPDEVAKWSDERVARQWWSLFPVSQRGESKKKLSHTPGKGQLDQMRVRLSSISWFMRCLCETVARQANRDEQYTGRFWSGRFKCQQLLDEAATMLCCAFVDLNPLRVRQAATLASSRYTSAYLRRQASQTVKPASPSHDDWLAPLEIGPRGHRSKSRQCTDRGFLPLSTAEYLRLLDWTGQQIRREKRSPAPDDIAAILERLWLVEDAWIDQVQNFGRSFQRVAGRPEALTAAAAQLGQRWVQGLGRSREAFR